MYWFTLAFLSLAVGYSTTKSVPSATSATAAAVTDEIRLLRMKAQRFVNACNHGDAKAAAAHYAKDAEIVDGDGRVTSGREAIQKQLEAFFARQKDVRFDLTCDSARQLTPEIIISRGCVTLVARSLQPIRSQYTAVLIKRDDEWLIENLVQTGGTSVPADGGPLQELEFLIGEWVEIDGDSVIHSVAEWTLGKRFIFRTFEIPSKGNPHRHGTEVIAWDPAAPGVH